jgi:hypothetical protein
MWKNNLDECLIYDVDFCEGKITNLQYNFKMFMTNLLGDDNAEQLEEFSDDIIEQQFPKNDEASEDDNTDEEI